MGAFYEDVRQATHDKLYWEEDKDSNQRSFMRMELALFLSVFKAGLSQ